MAKLKQPQMFYHYKCSFQTLGFLNDDDNDDDEN